MADHDVLDLEEAARAVNLPSGSTGQDGDLQLYVSGISGRIDKLCGPVVQRAIDGEEHDGGCRRILLRRQHVVAVTAASEWSDGVETELTVQTNASPDGTCRLYRGDQTIYAWLLRVGGTFAAGLGNVVVDYTAGRYADTESVDETFKLAAASVLRRIWKRESSSWSHTPDFFDDTDNPRPSLGFFKAVDPMVCELLGDQLLPPVGL